MAQLSITQAWNETAAFVKQEGRLLFPLAFMLVAFPVAVMEAFTPAPAAPGEMPSAGAWLLLFPLAMIAGMIGNLAISCLALRPGTSVGEAIGQGARSFLSLLGAALLLMIAGMLAFLVIAMVMVAATPGAIADAQSGVASGAVATATVLTMLALLPLLLFFGARLMLMTPIAVAEKAGPLKLIGRSWSLTRGHVWKLIGFLILIGILVMVVGAAVQAVAGLLFALVAGPPEPGSTSSLLVILVMAGVNTVVTAYLTSLVARIYAQLSGGGREQVFV